MTETRKGVDLWRRGRAHHSRVRSRAVIGCLDSNHSTPQVWLSDPAQVTILGLIFLICEMGLIMPAFPTSHGIVRG